MTSKKLEKILIKNGISNPLNKWIKIKQISIFHLTVDANIFVNPDCELYYIDTTNNLLRVSYDPRYYSMDEIPNNKNVNEYPTTTAYTLDIINGVITSVVAGPQGSYYTKRF